MKKTIKMAYFWTGYNTDQDDQLCQIGKLSNRKDSNPKTGEYLEELVVYIRIFKLAPKMKIKAPDAVADPGVPLGPKYL